MKHFAVALLLFAKHKPEEAITADIRLFFRPDHHGSPILIQNLRLSKARISHQLQLMLQGQGNVDVDEPILGHPVPLRR